MQGAVSAISRLCVNMRYANQMQAILKAKPGKLFTSRKEPQPATSERPMATRLCWRKRSRMLKHLAPAASATPSNDLVHPLHRSGSHSCPAQSSYSSARAPAQARASRGQGWKLLSQHWEIAAPCASYWPHMSQHHRNHAESGDRPGEARTCSEAGAGLGAAAGLAVAAHKADAALGLGAAAELLTEVLAGQAGAAAVAAAHAGAGRVRRPGLPRVVLGPLVHHLCPHSKALMSCLTRRLHLIPMRASALSGSLW